MFYIAIHIAAAVFGLNYSEFPNSCLLRQLVVRIYLFDMLIDSGDLHSVQLSHHTLCKPYILVFVSKFYPSRILSGSSDKCQVLGRRIANSYLFFDS